MKSLVSDQIKNEEKDRDLKISKLKANLKSKLDKVAELEKIRTENLLLSLHHQAVSGKVSAATIRQKI